MPLASGQSPTKIGAPTVTKKTDEEGTVTLLIQRVVQCGDDQAAQRLMDRYFAPLLHVADKKLGNAPRAVEDEEDVVISALKSFLIRSRRKQFPRLHDRHDLWPLLQKITERKAVNQRRRQTAQKRGGGKTVDLGAYQSTPSSGEHPVLASVQAQHPTPQALAEFKEQCRGLFASLPTDELRSLAMLKLQGHTNAEIAEQLGVVERTVERKLKLIRDQWSRKNIVMP